jgi:hypothetical protein
MRNQFISLLIEYFKIYQICLILSIIIQYVAYPNDQIIINLLVKGKWQSGNTPSIVYSTY